MKKLVYLFSILILSSSQIFAEDTFEYNEKNIESEFEQLNKIETYVLNHDGATLSEVQSQNPKLLAGIELNPESSTNFLKGDLPANIPPFIWGCVLGVIGILLVYILSDNDKDLTKKAVIGCLVGWGAGLIIYFIFVASIFGAASGL